MLRFFLHYGIHFLVPLAIGLLFFKEHRLKVVLILLAGILIDIDHVFARPIFDPLRCSINFHPLHTYWAIGVYIGLTLVPKTRLFGFALLLHIMADSVDCWLLFLQSK
jgi:hypothetical protein